MTDNEQIFELARLYGSCNPPSQCDKCWMNNVKDKLAPLYQRCYVLKNTKKLYDIGYRKNSGAVAEVGTNEEEIKQIAKAICDKSCSCDECRESSYTGCMLEDYCNEFEYAQTICNAGYRKTMESNSSSKENDDSQMFMKNQPNNLVAFYVGFSVDALLNRPRSIEGKFISYNDGDKKILSSIIDHQMAEIERNREFLSNDCYLGLKSAYEGIVDLLNIKKQ